MTKGQTHAFCFAIIYVFCSCSSKTVNILYCAQVGQEHRWGLCPQGNHSATHARKCGWQAGDRAVDFWAMRMIDWRNKMKKWMYRPPAPWSSPLWGGAEMCGWRGSVHSYWWAGGRGEVVSSLRCTWQMHTHSYLPVSQEKRGIFLKTGKVKEQIWRWLKQTSFHSSKLGF